MFDLLYCLVLDETEDMIDRRSELDAHLATYASPIEVGDRSHRDQLAATWGKLPAHQRAMRQGMAAGGKDAKADRKA